jgi:hypothetical protein
MFTEQEQDKIAEAIVEDLTRSNWKFEQGSSAGGGSHLSGKEPTAIAGAHRPRT